MFRKIFISLTVLGIVSCTNANLKEDKNKLQATKNVSIHKALKEFNKYGVIFEYPEDYLIEERIIEEGHYYKVYLDINDDTKLQSVQIEWRNNPLKYDPINGRQGGKEAVMNYYGNQVEVLEEYETSLNGNVVYWIDYLINKYCGQYIMKSGVTMIDDQVFVIQKISWIDDEFEEADKIFESIRGSKSDTK